MCETSANSFNHYVRYSNKINTLIVGTLTPPEGQAHGYFYSSSKNYLYQWLTELFEERKEDEDSFAYLKTKLICETSLAVKKSVIKQINLKLENKRIAFFDVIYSAKRKKKYSSSDKDLENEIFDTQLFNKIKNNIKRIIFTSKQAKDMFKTNLDKEDFFNDSNTIIWNLRYKKKIEELKKVKAFLGS